MDNYKFNAEEFEQQEESAITTSLKLAVIGAIFSTIGDGIGVLAALIAIDEAVIADQQEKKEQKELDDKLQKMQDQIDALTEELEKRSERS